ncbi:MAG: D-alanine--D-alanine ligase [Candidatus Omnitrophica bacterium]|nr:D-alanine--D-alanine ligase [Candidatus Omnitrophota bacterium]
MRVGLTYDLQTDPRDERQVEFDPPRTIERLCAALQELGHHVVRLGNAADLLASRTGLDQVDLVFNIAEGTHGRHREAWVPTLLELLHVPYVGSDPLALSLGLDKAACKRLARACGLPTPRWIAVDHPGAIPAELALAFPLIVKPRYQGSGIGIDEGAVVQDRPSLHRRAEWLFERWPESLIIEEFVGEGELTVCVIGNHPPTAYPAIQRPVHPESRLSCHVVRQDLPASWATPLELTDALDAEARRIALEMFAALGCRDMARVDLRADEQGTVWFLEINPLPSLDPEGSFGLLAEHLGVTYARLVGRILEAARTRLAVWARPAPIAPHARA